jgi:large subunit ribosomal protein L11
MAAPKKITRILNLEIPAGKANPSPPLGPMLGANGVAIGSFTKDFNDKTSEYMKQFQGFDVSIKCALTIYADRSYDIELLGPKTGDLIKRKLGLKSGS